MSSVPIRAVDQQQVVGGHQRRRAQREPRPAAGRAHQREHPEDRDRPEHDARQPPGQRPVAEQLDRPGHHQLGQLGMLGVRVVAERGVGVVRSGRWGDPGDHARGVDVVGLVEHQHVVGRPCRTGPGTASQQATRAPNDSTDTTASSTSGSERRRAAREQRVDIGRATVHIDCGRVEFEKWHALGNDYVIVEAAALPFELTADADPGDLRARTPASARDGILLLSEPDAPGSVARLRIFNPDGSEAELSGNGAREAVLYLRRRGWTDADAFAIQTAAGEIRPRITSDTECTVDMGRARTQSRRLPVGGRGRARRADRRRARLALSARPGRQPAVRDRASPTSRRSHALDLPAIGPADRAPRAVPQPDQRVLVHRAASRDGSGRGSSSAGWGRRSASGTGATGAAVAYVLDGGSSPVTVVARRRRARGRGGGGPAHQPDRLGGAGVPRHARRRVHRGVACDRVGVWS